MILPPKVGSLGVDSPNGTGPHLRKRPQPAVLAVCWLPWATKRREQWGVIWLRAAAAAKGNQTHIATKMTKMYGKYTPWNWN